MRRVVELFVDRAVADFRIDYDRGGQYPQNQAIARTTFLYEVDGGKPFAIAGIWEWWGGPAGENAPVESCAIITTDANELAREVHDRMPVILDAADYDAWLACGEVPLIPFASDRMTARPVNRYINKAGNESE